MVLLKLETIMNDEINKIKSSVKEEMAHAIEHLESALIKIRAGKANPSMLEGVMVDYYGSPTPISQVGNITTPDARSLSIKPWEKPMLAEIEKAIFAANLGITPQNDGENIRLNIPPLTEERRKELAKQIKAEGEHAKVSIRNSRKHGNDSVKQLGKDGLSEDLVKDAEGEIQNITNNYSEKIDKIVKAKENEVMTL